MPRRAGTCVNWAAKGAQGRMEQHLGCLDQTVEASSMFRGGERNANFRQAYEHKLWEAAAGLSPAVSRGANCFIVISREPWAVITQPWVQLGFPRCPSTVCSAGVLFASLFWQKMPGAVSCSVKAAKGVNGIKSSVWKAEWNLEPELCVRWRREWGSLGEQIQCLETTRECKISKMEWWGFHQKATRTLGDWSRAFQMFSPWITL